MKPEIGTFMNTKGLRNCWLQSAELSVYVRKGHHLINGKIRYCFDIGNIDGPPPEMQGRGIFTNWLAEVEIEIAARGIEYVFVESILNERLIPFLKKRGYLDVSGSNPPSMYKRLTKT